VTPSRPPPPHPIANPPTTLGPISHLQRNINRDRSLQRPSYLDRLPCRRVACSNSYGTGPFFIAEIDPTAATIQIGAVFIDPTARRHQMLRSVQRTSLASNPGSRPWSLPAFLFVIPERPLRLVIPQTLSACILSSFTRHKSSAKMCNTTSLLLILYGLIWRVIRNGDLRRRQPLRRSTLQFGRWILLARESTHQHLYRALLMSKLESEFLYGTGKMFLDRVYL